MTLPCVCELTAGGQKPPATAPATVRVDQQRRTQDRASSELPKGAPGPLRSQRRRSGQDGHPARCTGQLRPLAQTKTSQQIEHTRTSRYFCPSSAQKKMEVLRLRCAPLRMTGLFFNVALRAFANRRSQNHCHRFSLHLAAGLRCPLLSCFAIGPESIKL